MTYWMQERRAQTGIVKYVMRYGSPYRRLNPTYVDRISGTSPQWTPAQDWNRPLGWASSPQCVTPIIDQGHEKTMEREYAATENIVNTGRGAWVYLLPRKIAIRR